MADVAEYCKHAQPPPEHAKWNPGGLCCARFSQDQSWYRAKVLENLAGNRAKVSSSFIARKNLDKCDFKVLPMGRQTHGQTDRQADR